MGNALVDEMQNYMSMAKDRLMDAMEFSIFMRGMAPLDLDDNCNLNFQYDPSLNCDTHIETEFYISMI